jgi:prepilin-type N-terminal cleavage/methylation domain-containing protein
MKQNNLKKFPNGFTLIEILIIILILGVIGAALTGVLSRTFRANNKSQVLGNVKQNGQNAINDLSQTIRSAQDIVCINPQTDGKVITLKNKEGTLVRYIFVDPTSTENGVLKKDFPSYILNSIRVSNTDNFCDLTQVPLQQPSDLTDQNISKGVSVEEGKFNRFEKHTLGIYFVVKVAKNAPKDFSNQIGGTGMEVFSTTVQLR